MNAMGHAIPNTIGVEQRDLAEQITALVPNYMNMTGEGGTMGDMQMQMPLPQNTLKMMTGTGPHGSIEMGGMFTLVKIRADLAQRLPRSGTVPGTQGQHGLSVAGRRASRIARFR